MLAVNEAVLHVIESLASVEGFRVTVVQAAPDVVPFPQYVNESEPDQFVLAM
jgi:hypothetical protein